MVRSYIMIMALALLSTSMSIMAAMNSTSMAAANLTSVPTFILFNTTTAAINSIVGGVQFTKSPRGFNMSLMIFPGTYANISNVIYSSYNVTLSTFRVINVPAPANASNDTPRSAFLFQINHKIIQATAFVNSSGAPKPITFMVNHCANWTSWSYVNETVNGTGYTGGMYSKQNKWSYNTTTNTMWDVSLQRAQMHIYELMPGPASNYVTVTTSVATTIPTTTVATTIATTTINSSIFAPAGSMLLIAIIIAVIAIVLAAAVMMKKPKKK